MSGYKTYIWAVVTALAGAALYIHGDINSTQLFTIVQTSGGLGALRAGIAALK